MKKLLSVKPFGQDALAIIRFVTGVLMLIHGLKVFDSTAMEGMAGYLDKEIGLPLSLLMSYLAKGTEFFGGLVFALGFLTRLISIPLSITMLVAVFGAHHGEITGEAEHAFLFLLIFVTFFFIGSGKWSIDYLIRNFKQANPGKV